MCKTVCEKGCCDKVCSLSFEGELLFFQMMINCRLHPQDWTYPFTFLAWLGNADGKKKRYWKELTLPEVASHSLRLKVHWLHIKVTPSNILLDSSYIWSGVMHLCDDCDGDNS